MNYIEKQFIRQTSAILVFGAAMYDFLQDYVDIGVMREVGEGDNPLEIEAMSVNIAGYNK
jgi:hypothetical protein